jgi:hypothetical protein
MGATIQQEEGELRMLRITGVLRKAELDRALEAEARKWKPRTKVKVLAMLEDFKGWERGADWGDITFMVGHDDQIEKMAIVADPKWESEAMMFAGKGFRKAEVKFFPAGQIAVARAWLG